MPELPEVESIVRALRDGGRGGPSIIGNTITAACVSWHKTVATPSLKQFKTLIQQQQIQAIQRRAKYIDIQLSNYHLVVHLRMSGDLLVGRGSDPLGKYSRLLLSFDNGRNLSFDDARKFGRVWLLAETTALFSNLGPEPFSYSLDENQFYFLLQAKNRQIKPLLMDQRFIAGIGNIYADEALHLAKLHPQSSSRALAPEQAALLLKSIRRVLQEGIDRNGASIDWVYKGGDFQNYFRVYQRTGEACLACETKIVRIVVGQRGTHFCPNCQPRT